MIFSFIYRRKIFHFFFNWNQFYNFESCYQPILCDRTRFNRSPPSPLVVQCRGAFFKWSSKFFTKRHLIVMIHYAIIIVERRDIMENKLVYIPIILIYWLISTAIFKLLFKKQESLGILYRHQKIIVMIPFVRLIYYTFWLL